MNLPPFVFIIGLPGSGRATFANLLYEADHTRTIASFDEAIREATLAIFYPEHLHQDIDLRDPAMLAANVPFTSMPLATWLLHLRMILRNASDTILGDLLKKRLSQDRARYSSYLILDAAEPADIKPFVNAFGHENCLLVVIERAGFPPTQLAGRFTSTFLPMHIVRNPEGNPGAMLSNFEASYGRIPVP